MAIDFQRSKPSSYFINMTPLIDVVFLLIVFFMLTTSFVKTESIEIAFPTEEQVEGVDKDSVIVIVVVDSERIYLGRNRVEPSELQGKLREILAEDPERAVLLMSSELNTVQEVVSIMDMVYQSGGKNVAVSNWRPKAKP